MHFNKGDSVTVCMDTNHCFWFQTGPRFSAVIEHVPDHDGGLWQFKVLLCEGYVYLAINPQSSSFIGLEAHEQN